MGSISLAASKLCRLRVVCTLGKIALVELPVCVCVCVCVCTHTHTHILPALFPRVFILGRIFLADAVGLICTLGKNGLNISSCYSVVSCRCGLYLGKDWVISIYM